MGGVATGCCSEIKQRPEGDKLLVKSGDKAALGPCDGDAVGANVPLTAAEQAVERKKQKVAAAKVATEAAENQANADAIKVKEQAVEIERLLVERNELQQICEARAAEAKEAAIQRQALDDDNAATVGRLERDIHEDRRRCETQVAETARALQRSEELSQMLEQRAEDSGQKEAKYAALQRKLEEMIRRSREQEALTAHLDVENIDIHQQWHEAVACAWRLMQEKAPRIKRKTGSLSTLDDLEQITRTTGMDDKSKSLWAVVAAEPTPSKTREQRQSQDPLTEQDMPRLPIQAEER